MVLREEILAVIAKHVEVSSDKVQIRLDRGQDMSTLDIDIELPLTAVRSARPVAGRRSKDGEARRRMSLRALAASWPASPSGPDEQPGERRARQVGQGAGQDRAQAVAGDLRPALRREAAEARELDRRPRSRLAKPQRAKHRIAAVRGSRLPAFRIGESCA